MLFPRRHSGISLVRLRVSLEYALWERIWLTSARCCCPVAKVLSLSAVGVLFPLVAKSGMLISSEALVEG